jgi:hypothetical protein
MTKMIKGRKIKVRKLDKLETTIVRAGLFGA